MVDQSFAISVFFIIMNGSLIKFLLWYTDESEGIIKLYELLSNGSMTYFDTGYQSEEISVMDVSC